MNLFIDPALVLMIRITSCFVSVKAVWQEVGEERVQQREQHDERQVCLRRVFRPSWFPGRL